MKKFLFALLTALLVLFAATAVGLAVIHISGQPYITDVDKLELVESSGLSREEIMENYNAVMRFLSPFINEPFDLPTLKYSQSGAGLHPRQQWHNPAQGPVFQIHWPPLPGNSWI